MTRSVMSIRWLAKTTGSCRIRSNFSLSAICWMTLFARSCRLAQLLVLAQVQVLAELALRALQVTRHVGEIALLVAPVGLGHRRAVLVQLLLQRLHLLGELLDLRVTRGELLLQLGLRALGWRRLAEQPLGIDEADLVVRGDRRAGSSQAQQRGAGQN